MLDVYVELKEFNKFKDGLTAEAGMIFQTEFNEQFLLVRTDSETLRLIEITEMNRVSERNY